jgi:signal transduction histidine kinase
LKELNHEIESGNFAEVKAIAKNVIDNQEKINQHGKRADGIVKNMLQHSRTSSGQKELTDLNSFCDEYLRLAYHGYRAKDKIFNIKIETAFDPTIPQLNIIPQDVGRVLLNLINNAFYAVNEQNKIQQSGYEPVVKLTTKNLGSKIEIGISDNGPGIPDAIKKKIFQPFFTTKPTGQGTGLGLSLSYDIVTKGHGGELKLAENITEGSMFIMHLPLSTVRS